MTTVHSHGCLLSSPVSFVSEVEHVEHRRAMTRHGTHHGPVVKAKQTNCRPGLLKGQPLQNNQ